MERGGEKQPQRAAERAEQALSARSCRASRPRLAPRAPRIAHLGSSLQRAGERQVGDVGAGDEQNESDGADENEQRRAHSARELPGQGHHIHSSGREGGGVLRASWPRTRSRSARAWASETPAASRPNAFRC